MLRSRLIPVLVLESDILVKTVRFGNPKYLGDPLNAVRIFNEMEADEIIVVDRLASVGGSKINFSLISRIADECRMPLSYGGGVRAVNEVEELVSIGVEKVCLGSSIFLVPNLISDSVRSVGSASVSVVIDYRDDGLAYSHNGRRTTGLEVRSLAKEVEEAGAGELLFHSIDGDGTYRGLDQGMLSGWAVEPNVPRVFVGGAGSLDDVSNFARHPTRPGVGVGSLFLLTGKFRSALISYPEPREKKILMSPRESNLS